MNKIISALYNPETDCVEVTLDNQFHVTFNCQNCNAQVKLADPLDIAYLTRLAREEPGFYASLASRTGGLQGYVDAMGSGIKAPPLLLIYSALFYINPLSLFQTILAFSFLKGNITT